MAKMTRKETFEALKDIVREAVEDAELAETYVNFLDHEIEKTQRPHSQTKAQKENAALKEEIMNYFAETGKQETATEVWQNGFSDYSMQKITSLISQLVKENRLVRTQEGSKSRPTFSVAG